MLLELQFSNEIRVLPSLQAFVHSALKVFPLPADERDRLEELVASGIQNVLATAYPVGEEGLIKLTIQEKAEKLEIRIRDFGLPQEVSVLEKRLREAGLDAASLHGSNAAEVVDQMHWHSFGPHGKELRLVKWLHASSTPSTSAEEITSVAADTPLAPKQQYTVRRMLSEEAVQVSQLMYRTYGTTYFNEDVYYPARIASQNLHDTLISIVAVGDDGRVAGHCALERNQDGRVAEIGQAAVDPAHRGRGLLDQMKAALEKEAQKLGLAGWYADAVTVHTFTQQSNAHHGGHVCGVDLAVSPKSEAFRKLAAKQQQRISCVLYFHWLDRPEVRSVCLPARHQEIAGAIYENLQCPVSFGESARPTLEHGTLTVKLERRASLATIHAPRLGKDSDRAIRHAARELVEHSRAKAVLVELPLVDTAAAHVCEALEADGFGFTGIGPHFSTAGDILKLAYLVEPLVREPIKTFEPFADRLVDYALDEQERVRANL